MPLRKKTAPFAENPISFRDLRTTASASFTTEPLCVMAFAPRSPDIPQRAKDTYPWPAGKEYTVSVLALPQFPQVPCLDRRPQRRGIACRREWVYTPQWQHPCQRLGTAPPTRRG